MRVEIHELAAKEFEEAIEWYQHQSKGLGSRFKKSVIEQVKKIKKNPEWFLIENGNVLKLTFQNSHIKYFLQLRIKI